MMEPEYLNEDDMINDYIEDIDEEQEHYFDDEYDVIDDASATKNNNMEDWGDAVKSNNNNNNNTGTTATPTTTNESTDFLTAFSGGNYNDADTNSNNNTAAPVVTPVTTASEIRDEYRHNRHVDEQHDHNNNNGKKKKNDHDLYGFKRYNHGLAWRNSDATNEKDNNNRRLGRNSSSKSNTMEATKWKSNQHTTASSKRTVSSSTSADTQLMEFYHRRHISRKRVQPQIQLPSTNHSTNDTQQQQQQQQQQRIFIQTSTTTRLHPKEGEDSIPLTLGNGTRLYITTTTNSTTNKDQKNSDNSSQQQLGNNNKLLGVSMSDLMRRVQSIRRKKEHQKGREGENILSSEENTANDNDGEDPKNSPTKHNNLTQDATNKNNHNQNHDNKNNNNNQEHKLWVDKHAPSSFTSLLSDERTNREVIRALREWDPFVFHRDPPKRSIPQNQQQQPPTTKPSQPQNNNKNPKDRRPESNRRVILLSGPPGVGKTTLAHIAAKHVGYRPLEINASDERSTTVLKDRVLRTMESNTLRFGPANNQKKSQNNNHKPNCLILDEIDGADAKGAIEALVEIIRAEAPTAAAKQQKTAKKPFLTRPIVFICNNKYAPALRPLLPYCMHFNVVPPMTNRLVARLNAVLCSENVSLSSSGVLHQLVNATGGDIRSCLFTLQIVATGLDDNEKNNRKNNNNNGGTQKKRNDITKALLSSLQGGKGKKDARMDIMGVIQTIFCKDKQKDQVFGKKKSSYLVSQILSKRHSSKKVQTILDSVENFGDYSKVLDCLFLNLNRVPYIDPTMEKCSISLEWLSSVDTYRSGGSSNNNNNEFLYSLQRYYIPIGAAAIHALCCVDNIPTHWNTNSSGVINNNLTYSTRALSDARYQHDANLGVLSKFSDGLSPKIRTSRKNTTLAMDTIPYSLWVLSAGDGIGNLNRPASSFEILTTLEQENFVVHTTKLRALGLIYTQKDGGTATTNNHNKNNIPEEERKQQPSEIRLEPPIDQLVQFVDLHVLPPYRERTEIPNVMKGLLAQRTIHDRLCSTTVSKDDDSSTVVSPTKASAASSMEGDEDGRNHGTKKNSSENKRKRSDREQQQENDTSRPSKLAKKGDAKPFGSDSNAKKETPSVLARKNFLGVGAKKIREARSARKKAALLKEQGGGGGSFNKKKQLKKSNTGSGVLFSQVIRLKYVKGFTQAVRNPCRLDDL